MDLGEWLRGLGLGQYEPAFHENGVDDQVLPDLTEADLEKLGVLLGHRKRLLKAIARLTSGGDEPAPPVARTDPKPRDAAERRQLTVVFCDLVGSTALAAGLDPEDMREIIAAYHQCCASLIERNGGFVAKYMGDGVLAYFGYPLAHEHDAERAVRAGLSIVDAAPKLKTAADAPLHVRVGIATGVVVVGDLLGSGELQERGIVGDTPNLAARLQGIAAPDSVVIAEGTRRLLGDLFDLADLGPRALKGVAAPARAYAALSESVQESRFEALHAGGLTALVGREEESELLLRRWARAKAGEGQVVLLSGEAGIGKSRLTAALLERLAGEPHVRMRYFCSPQHSDSAFHPIIGQMERAAGLAREDDGKTRLDKLDALLALSATSHEGSTLIAEMLSLPNDGRYPALDLAPQQRRRKTIDALIGQIETLSRQSPILMIVEDAHWADPSSLEVVGRLIDKIEGLRVLLFVTFRPDFAAPWIGRPHVTALTINRLAPAEVMALIDRVAGDKALAANIRQDIVERADGIPLFVEEMTKAVLEAGDEAARARAAAAIPSPALAVPASLHASLMARLDRLGSAKDVAQIGAAIGREFAYALLGPVARLPEAELLKRSTASFSRVSCLARARRPTRLISLSTRWCRMRPMALCYASPGGRCTRALRRRLKTTSSISLRADQKSWRVATPRRAKSKRRRVIWGKAGQRSLARSALVEAEVQLSRALAQIATLPSSTVLRREQIKLQVGTCPRSHAHKGLCGDRNQSSAGGSANVDRPRRGTRGPH